MDATLQTPKKALDGKGKQKDLPELEWTLGWEHALALVEDQPKAIAWSRTNPVFFAHAFLPQVCGRYIHPNASTPVSTFELPIPPQIELDPSMYSPPTSISLSPNDTSLFAYFPPSPLSQFDGFACIYQSGLVLGVWSIAHMWPVKCGNGIVASQWLGQTREWSILSGRRPQRCTTNGPRALRPPMLLLVTQSHQIEMLHRPSGLGPQSAFNHMKCPLDVAWGTTADGPPILEGVCSTGGSRLCVKAAIGFSPDNASLIVATSSRLLPDWSFRQSLSLQGYQLAQPSPVTMAEPTWETWGDEEKISLTQVVIEFNNVGTVGNASTANNVGKATMETLPLTAIPTDTAPLNVSAEDDDADEVASAWQLTHLEFMTVPHRPTSAPVQVKRETSGDTGMVTSGPPEEGGIPEQPDDSRVLQLAASFVDLGAYKSTPRSIIKLWTLSPEKRAPEEELSPGHPTSATPEVASDLDATGIVSHLTASRIFDSGVVSILQLQAMNEGQRLCAGIIDVKGVVDSGKEEGRIGALKVLTFDLEDDVEFAEVELVDNRQAMLQSLPAAFLLSPSRALAILAPMGPYSLDLKIIRAPSRLVQAAPPEEQMPPPNPDANPEGAKPAVPRDAHHPHNLSSAATLAVIRNSDLSDVIRAFWAQTDASPESASALLRDVAEAMSTLMPPPSNPFSNPKEPATDLKPTTEQPRVLPLDPRMLGLALGLFKAAPDPLIAERWWVASHLILLRSTRDAFMDLKPIFSTADFANSSETSPLLKLIGLTTRYVELCETLVKEAIIWEAWRACGADKEREGLEQPMIQKPEPSGALIAFLHPRALELLAEVLASIKAMQTQLSQANHLSKRRVSAIMDDAKVDFVVFAAVLDDIRKLVQVDVPAVADHLLSATFSLALPIELRPMVNSCTELINKRPGLSQKISLIVSSSTFPELGHEGADGGLSSKVKNKFASTLARLGSPNSSIAAPPMRLCLRCGEKSDTLLHDMMTFTVYGAYVRKWRRQCPCSGFWMLDRSR